MPIHGPYALALLSTSALGAASDVLRRRIPNALTLLVGMLGLAAQLTNGGVLGLCSGAAAIAAVVAALFWPWQAHGIGGGDVKLMAAVGAWIGLGGLLWFGLLTALAGGVVSLVCFLASSRQARQSMRANLTMAVVDKRWPAAPAAAGRIRVPYGVAIFAGAGLCVFLGVT